MVEALTFLAVVGAIACVGFLVPAFQPYRRPMPFVAFLLGISSGFPLTLLLATMTFWLSKEGVDKTAIGFAIGLTTPYTLKFLWAPLVDKLSIPVLTPLFGQRRSWLFLIQGLLFASLWQLGGSDPANQLSLFPFCSPRATPPT